MRRLSLNKLIFAGAFLGIAFGIILGHTDLPAPATAPWLSFFGFLGKTFISILKVLVIPLIFTSIVAGIANLHRSPRMHRVWPTLIAYALVTTSLAVATGLIAVNLFKPGVGADIQMFKTDMASFKAPEADARDILPLLAHSIFANPLKAIGQSNVLALVIFAIMIGIFISLFGKRADAVHTLINKLFHMILRVVQWVMWLAPLGVMGLLAKMVAQQNVQFLHVLLVYMAVVFGATLIHGAVTLPALLWLVTRRNPLEFFHGMRDAFITAFSTSSSSATLPISLRCVTDNLKVDPKTAGFVLPVAAVLNMDGTALYEAIAAIFVANLCGIDLSLPQQLVVGATAMFASVGAPGIPSAGMVTMILVLQSVGLPSEAVAILIPIDRPLDTFRTVVNVEGDCIGACIVDHVNKA